MGKDEGIQNVWKIEENIFTLFSPPFSIKNSLHFSKYEMQFNRIQNAEVYEKKEKKKSTKHKAVIFLITRQTFLILFFISHEHFNICSIWKVFLRQRRVAIYLFTFFGIVL